MELRVFDCYTRLIVKRITEWNLVKLVKFQRKIRNGWKDKFQRKIRNAWKDCDLNPKQVRPMRNDRRRLHMETPNLWE